MNNVPDKKSNRLDTLDQKLYSPHSPDIINKKVKPLEQIDVHVPHEWQEAVVEEEVSEQPKPKGRGALVFFIIAFLFAIASFGFAWFYIVNKGDVASKVAITVTGPVSTPAGTEYPLEISITNTNSFPLEVVDMVVQYPTGTKRVDVPDQDIGTYREGLGTIAPGETVVRTIDAVLFGESQQKQIITARAEYRIPNSNAIFKKEKDIDVLIESGPVEFSLETLEESIIGQETTMTLRIRSNTDAPIVNMLVVADIPQGFTMTHASPEATYDSNVWLIDVLEPRETTSITIKGVFNGETGTDKFIRFSAGVPDTFDTKKIANMYASSLERIGLVEAFLSADIVFKQGNIINAGGVVRGTIEWKNNSGGTLTDVGIELKLDGVALNRKVISAEKGFFRSTENKIIWNKTTNPEFAKIDNGQTGVVDFEFGTLDFEQYASLTKNPEVNLDVSLAARRPTQSGVPEEIRSTATSKVRVASEVGFTAKSVYYIGPFTNKGPLPPVPETETTYTIIWTLTNSSNDISGTQVTAYLPLYMKWNNKVSPASDRVTFDETTRKITWNIGTLAAGTGYTKPSREVAFQVTLFPGTNQEGESPTLVSNIEYSGTDSFTTEEFTDQYDNAITTRMIYDPNFVSTMEKVGGE